MAQRSSAPFTRDDMLNELGTIMLFMADQIAMTKSIEAAIAYIGFESDQYHKEPPNKVNLKDFNVTSTLNTLYSYAFQTEGAHYVGENIIQDGHVFQLGMPRCGGQLEEGGETHPFMGPEGMCRRTVETAQARWTLDNHETDLTVRQLALLANMTEGAVRNALGAAGIKAKGPRTSVPLEFAETWLPGRRGFIPTTCWAYGAEDAERDIFQARDVRSFSDALSRLAGELDLSSEAIASRAGLPADHVVAWLSGKISPDIGTAITLARTLGLDPALVAGRAVELALRANGFEKQEEHHA